MIDAVETGHFDLVTLDLGLDKTDEFAPARKLWANRNVPFIIISGLGHPHDRADGLAAGADDYVVKPFDQREVAIRVKRVLDRYAAPFAPPSRAVRLDSGVIDLDKGTIRHVDGSALELTDLEQRLLELFLARRTQILSRDDIAQALHGRDWSPYDRTIDGHVARLRRKLEQGAEAARAIRTVRGVGYVFAADVMPVS
jgi:two-component system phosphate regulon response regulator OmpR